MILTLLQESLTSATFDISFEELFFQKFAFFLYQLIWNENYILLIDWF